MKPKTVQVGSSPLALEDVFRVAQGFAPVALSRKASANLKKGRSWIEPLVESATSTAFYGVNTGFGSLKNVRIPKHKLNDLQVNLIRSHAVGVGPELSSEVVRAMMLLRAHTVSLGYSGVRETTARQLLDMLNAQIYPCVPAQGSVGASGDLAPLAHLALAMIGEGEVWLKGKRLRAAQALHQSKIKPLKPEAKEALALLNGTQMMTAVGVLALLRAERLLKCADIAGAATLEATLGSPRAFDARVHELRPHIGQQKSANNLRKLADASEIYASHANCDRVQDAYSIRCAPQVHGAARDALVYVRRVLEIEVDSVTDNPIVFPKDRELISAGNFHGQPVAVALDTMALALTSVASISERRTFRLLNPALSELPAGLVKDAGLNSGAMMLQVTAASLVSECKTLSHPASVDSIPTWADQEDHVSMGAFAARKAAQVVEALSHVVAIELFCACQALEFRRPLNPGRGVSRAYDSIREIVPPIESDRYMIPDVELIRQLMDGGELLSEVEDEIGDLE